jgi:predicted Zn-dependent protease
MQATEQMSSVKIVSFQPLLEQRKSFFFKQRQSTPESMEGWWNHFNALRISSASKATREILIFLKDHHENPAFHNLLALSQIDEGNLAQAKITLLSLLARGFDKAAVFNNLGIIEAQRGNFKEAVSYFRKAADKESAEANLNQGLMALSIRNGATAQLFFEKSMEMKTIDLAQISAAIARIQNGELELGTEQLALLRENFPNNPLLKAQEDALRTVAQSRSREIASESMLD